MARRFQDEAVGQPGEHEKNGFLIFLRPFFCQLFLFVAGRKMWGRNIGQTEKLSLMDALARLGAVVHAQHEYIGLARSGRQNHSLAHTKFHFTGSQVGGHDD